MNHELTHTKPYEFSKSRSPRWPHLESLESFKPGLLASKKVIIIWIYEKGIKSFPVNFIGIFLHLEQCHLWTKFWTNQFYKKIAVSLSTKNYHSSVNISLYLILKKFELRPSNFFLVVSIVYWWWSGALREITCKRHKSGIFSKISFKVHR